MSDTITAILENWYPIQSTSKEMLIVGECYADSLRRFPDGTLIETSAIKNRSLSEGDLVQTRNNIYKLGKKYENDLEVHHV